MEVKYREINLILENIDVYYHEAAQKLGLSDAEFDVLYILIQSDEYTPQKKIYQETGKSKSTINSAIKKMENEGILKLKEMDGRSVQVKLTDKGTKLANNTVAIVVDIENRIYDSWSEEDKKTILKLNRNFMEQFAKEVANIKERKTVKEGFVVKKYDDEISIDELEAAAGGQMAKPMTDSNNSFL